MAEALSRVELYLQELAERENRGRITLDSIEHGARMQSGQLHSSWLEPSTLAAVTQLPESGIDFRYSGRFFESRGTPWTQFEHVQVTRSDRETTITLFREARTAFPHSASSPREQEVRRQHHTSRRLPVTASARQIKASINELMDAHAPIRTSETSRR